MILRPRRVLAHILCTTTLLGVGVSCDRTGDSRGELPANAEGSGTSPFPHDEYERVLQDGFERVVGNCPQPVPENVHARNVREFMTSAYCAMWLHDLRGDAHYLEQARASFQAVLGAWRRDEELMQKHLNPFFVAELFFQIEQYLESQHALPDETRLTIRRYVEELNPQLTKEDNQDLAYAVGLSYTMRHYSGARKLCRVEEFRRADLATVALVQKQHRERHDIYRHRLERGLCHRPESRQTAEKIANGMRSTKIERWFEYLSSMRTRNFAASNFRVNCR